ncbi:hypothetical protein ACFC1T_15480 [Kitasatospora sp. NPDC056076]|uniref:hypothetical protein n=1 Tax=Kitasatospora sp. NPDC056076 TaxID=3345703 RepID=UPI0035DB9B8C
MPTTASAERNTMRFPWRRRPVGRSARLLDLAGVDPRSVDDDEDLDVCRQVAFRVARRDHGGTAEVLALIEELLADEAEYAFAVTFLEDLQNLASHGLDAFRSPAETRLLLGPRAAVCWDTVAAFWAEVAEWRAANGKPLEPSAAMLGTENEQLRLLLWTSNRTLPGGEKLGIADVVRFEKAVGSSLPGYSHIAVAMNLAGRVGP